MMKRKSFLILVSCAAVLTVATAVVFLMRKPPVRYQVTFLPSLGGFRTDPHSLNDRGQVVGVSETPTGAIYVFLWDREQGFRTLERYDDPPHAGGLSINNVGQIIGTMADPNGNQRAFFWDLNAGKQRLGALGGKQSSAESLNNKGQVVGNAEVPARHRHAFVWDAAGGMRDLGTLGGLNSNALSINDVGQIVGFAETSDRRTHMVVWEPNPKDPERKTQDDIGSDPQSAVSSPPSGDASVRQVSGYTMTDLGYAGVGPLTCEINNVGLAVRRYGLTTGKTYFMTWTKAAGWKKLNLVLDSAVPCGLNEKNQFLIRAKPTGWRLFGRVVHRRHQCFLWDPNSGSLLLESHLPVKDVVHFMIRELNNNGQIVATLRTKDSSQIRAVLIEPVKE